MSTIIILSNDLFLLFTPEKTKNFSFQFWKFLDHEYYPFFFLCKEKSTKILKIRRETEPEINFLSYFIPAYTRIILIPDFNLR